MKIEIKETTTLGAGVSLKLSVAQISARRHLLKDGDKKGTVETIGLVQFKTGETIDYLGNPDLLPRSLQPDKPAGKKTGSKKMGSHQSANAHPAAQNENSIDNEADTDAAADAVV